MTDQEIESTIRRILVEDFDVDAAKLTHEANLFTDLDLDSIDAIDLVVRLRQETGRKMDPEDFRQIRTLKDVVAAVSKLVNG
ncbi:MAG: acyl carrier protein [Kiritimatiellia bacterium]